MGRMAETPDSLMSTVWPFRWPQVRELMEIWVSILNRGWRRLSTGSPTGRAAACFCGSKSHLLDVWVIGRKGWEV